MEKGAKREGKTRSVRITPLLRGVVPRRQRTPPYVASLIAMDLEALIATMRPLDQAAAKAIDWADR